MNSYLNDTFTKVPKMCSVYLRVGRNFFSIFTALALLFTVLGAGAQTSPPLLSNDTIIDNGDLLYVIIPKEVTSEFNPTEKNYFKEKVEVDRHGYIFLPTQGNLKIAGQTPKQVSEILTNNLPKYLSKSDKASVNLIEKRHYIQILGHVQAPGWYNIQESANIQAILGQAGGVLEGANLSKVSITRTENGKTKKIEADIKQYLLQGDTNILPTLHENDTVFVPLSPPKDVMGKGEEDQKNSKIRIFGAVNQPGIYQEPEDRELNILDLLIMAGGETEIADLSNINIMRSDGSKEPFNMDVLIRTQASEENKTFPIIHGGDIVHIPKLMTKITRDPKTITMAGPGSINRGLRSFVEPMTPFEAISQAGGVTDFADTNDIVIIRKVDGKQQNFPYNYDKALKGEEPDVSFQLQANDIIYIP